MSNVFVIINEWTDIQHHTSSAIAGDGYFATEGEAMDHLRVIAEAYDVEMEPDETSLQLEDHAPHLTYEEFYIQELMKL